VKKPEEKMIRQCAFDIIEKSKDGDRASAVFDWFLTVLSVLGKKKERKKD